MDVSEFVKLASYIENLNLTSAKTVSHMSFLFNLRDSAWSCIAKIKTHVHVHGLGVVCVRNSVYSFIHLSVYIVQRHGHGLIINAKSKTH